MSLFAPELLDLAELPSMPLRAYRNVPPCPALYFVLTLANEVCYIGRAMSLKARWRYHHRLMDFWDIDGLRIAWVSVSDPALLPALERACLAYFQPSMNAYKGIYTEQLLILVPLDLKQWVEEQPEDASALVRRLLADERQRRDDRQRQAAAR